MRNRSLVQARVKNQTTRHLGIMWMGKAKEAAKSSRMTSPTQRLEALSPLRTNRVKEITRLRVAKAGSIQEKADIVRGSLKLSMT